MNKNEVIRKTIDIIHKHNVNDFESAISLPNTSGLIVSAASFSLGAKDVVVTEAGNTFNFIISFNDSGSECVTLDAASCKLSGGLARDLKKAFRLAIYIETVLSQAMNYPHELRQSTIESVCTELDISDEFYSNVFSNWKSFS